jgi:cytochrome c553
MTRVDRASILALTLFSVVVAAGFDSPGSRRQTAQSVPSTADRVAQMRHHFSDVTLVDEAVIRGDLAAVREPALKVARVAMPAAMPASAEPFITELRRAGQRAAEAKTLEAAARATAEMVTACANCHRAVGTYPSPPMPARRDVGGIVGQMQEHQLALDDMLLGLMIPSPSHWREGADRLRVVPLLPAKIPQDLKVTDETRKAEVRAHQLAEQALKAESVTDRTEIYAQVITNCSQCHNLHSKVWGPGRGGFRP